MKVVGIDSSMNNTGIMVCDLSEDVPAVENTHNLFKILETKTIVLDDSESRLDRLIQNSKEVQILVESNKPDLLVIEGAIDKGPNRSTTGVALFAMLMSRWLDPDFDCWKPSAIVSLSPERHISIAHRKMSVSGTEKVANFKKFQNVKGRVSVHQADAYTLLYYGTRFYMTMKELWPKSVLNSKEIAVFFDFNIRGENGRRMASKSMVNEKGLTWWF